MPIAIMFIITMIVFIVIYVKTMIMIMIVITITGIVLWLLCLRLMIVTVFIMIDCMNLNILMNMMIMILINSMAYGARRFNAAFTRAHQKSLSWAEFAKFLVRILISLRSILILSSHLCLYLPKGLFPIGVGYLSTFKSTPTFFHSILWW